MSIFIGNPGSQMHIWLETSLWWPYYHVRNFFTENISIHNPQRTIPDICVLPEHRYRPGVYLIMMVMFRVNYCIYQQDNASYHMGRIIREVLDAI